GAETAFAESGLIKEWAATAFLTARAPGGHNCATLLAGDATRGILVFEDLGAGLGSLADPLQHGTAAGAERALAASAAAAGRLHADAAGCPEDHTRALQAAFPAARRRPPDRRAQLARIDVMVRELIGGPPPPADEIEQIAQKLDAPGPWLSLVH